MPGAAGNRVYVVNSPNLVVSVQRLHTKLSFWSVAAAFAGQLGGLSPYAEKCFLDNARGEEGKPSLMRAEMENAHASFRLSSQFLHESITRTLRILEPSIGKLDQQDKTKIELGRWVVDEVRTSVTGSIFGAQNPFEDPSVGEAFESVYTNVI